MRSQECGSQGVLNLNSHSPFSRSGVFSRKKRFGEVSMTANQVRREAVRGRGEEEHFNPATHLVPELVEELRGPADTCFGLKLGCQLLCTFQF